MSPRTLDKYVSMGLLPRPVTMGRYAQYPAESRDRIKAIRDLVYDGRVTLGDLAERPWDKKTGWGQAS